MLRVTAESTSGCATVRVEGHLAGKWVEVLSRVAVRALAENPRVVVDLADVTFVDHSGVTLLRTLRDRGVELSRGSSFIGSLLNGVTP